MRLIKLKYNYIIILFTVFCAGAHSVNAQQNEPEQNNIQGKNTKGKHLLLALKNSNMEGSLRSFFSATYNKPGLSNHYAQAAGGGIRWESGSFHGFQFVFGAYTIMNVKSTDLTRRDPATLQPNRYEVGLFDMARPAKRFKLNRLDELNLNYQNKLIHLVLGRQFINTPFINMQDGRMRPTAVSGIWVESKALAGLRISGGWINAISPRGTIHWYKTANSIGVYPVGVNPDGKPSGYAGNIQSKGVALLGLNYEPDKKLLFQAWQMLVEHVSYTGLLQAAWRRELRANRSIKLSAQTVMQHSLNDGGNPDPAKSYFGKNTHSLCFGGSAALTLGPEEISLNYNRITAAGRYLVPREWGRDPFFTFLPRERNDGLGDVHALVLKSSLNTRNKKLKYTLGMGYFKLPDVRNTLLNKYGMPSYVQVNSDLRYAFLKGWLKGLDAQFLLVHKRNAGAVYNNPKYIYNKVDMTLYNIVFNYSFSLYRPAIKK